MRWVIATVIAMLVASARPAIACDPSWDWCDDRYDPYWALPASEEPSTWWWEEPIYEPAPAATPSAAWSDPVTWSAPGSDVLDASVGGVTQLAPTPVTAAPDPEAERIALGLHQVSEAWTGHVVTSDGPVTSFSSSSVAMDTGTSARLAASVGTGESSGYDGLLFGGRMSLSDGRLVKGDVYANYVWNGHEWVLDRYVFFQDDLEIARAAQVTVEPIPVSVAPPAAPPPAAAPPSSAIPAATPAASAPAFVAPVIGDVPPPPAAVPPSGGPSQPVSRAIRAGIALAPQAEPLGRVEVLRGRSVPLWVRATIDGTPARVLSWRLASGEVVTLGPVSGNGDEPLVATWHAITAPGATFAVGLRASVEVPGDVPQEVDAVIDVVVRSPALVD